VTPVLSMLYRSVLDDSRSIDDTFRVIRMTIVSDAPKCGLILMTRGVIYERNIFIIQATDRMRREATL
jgi:hypothetical protein